MRYYAANLQLLFCCLLCYVIMYKDKPESRFLYNHSIIYVQMMYAKDIARKITEKNEQF